MDALNASAMPCSTFLYVAGVCERSRILSRIDAVHFDAAPHTRGAIEHCPRAGKKAFLIGFMGLKGVSFITIRMGAWLHAAASLPIKGSLDACIKTILFWPGYCL